MMKAVAQERINNTTLTIDRQRDGSYCFVTTIAGVEATIPFDRVNLTSDTIEFFRNGQPTGSIVNDSTNWGSVGAWLHAEHAEPGVLA